jgi:hypothetical protein
MLYLAAPNPPSNTNRRTLVRRRPLLDVSRHRVFSAAEIERSPHSEDQEARALELEAFGDFKGAERVRSCGVRYADYTWTCKRRDCPSCAQHLAQHHSAIVNADIRVMRDPVVLILALLSPPRISSTNALASSLQQWRLAFARLQRRRSMALVKACAGGLEVKLTADRRRWNVHAHLVLDALDLDVAAVSNDWKQLTQGHGAVVLHPTPDLVSSAAQSAYATKAAGFCPPPGSLSLDELDELRAGLKGRRLLVRFGGAS